MRWLQSMLALVLAAAVIVLPWLAIPCGHACCPGQSAHCPDHNSAIACATSSALPAAAFQNEHTNAPAPIAAASIPLAAGRSRPDASPQHAPPPPALILTPLRI